MTTATATLPDPRTPWLTRIPARYEPVAVCLPHAGLGASAFSSWPVGIGGARVLPVQPPGHESRFRERCPVSVDEFAEGLARALRGLRPRPLLFVGHCGAVPYALETARLLRESGTPATQMRLLASSWGAPHRDIYGPLNQRPLHLIDTVAEVTAMMSGRAMPLDPELAEVYGDVLMDDLRAMRGYRFDASEGLPLSVTVLGWSDDAVVPREQAHAGWDQLGAVRLRALTGDHRAFWACGQPLRELIADEVRELVGDAH
ncbi:thioesterase II family protein [Streptomyces triticirhizae]|uniref:Thioesterase n=1 Tax=Streptomyces triticirhizae TaxID=2483353 RepID=A0A3M2LGR7_9ACTN|nr:thioesterase domain-containing protein [Streptomyces triticirhizae]RMI36246.1 thioesterase [Streptomyces triticirhizae]